MEEKKTGKKRIWLIIALCVLLLALLAAVPMLYVFPGGRPIARNAKEADLRDLELSVEEFNELAKTLPQCHILWMIPIGESRYDCSAAEITIDSLDSADVALFAYFDDLRTVNAMDVQTYDTLKALSEQLPGCDVRWAVHLGSGAFSPDTRDLLLDGTAATADELLEKLPLLPDVESISLTDTTFPVDQQLALVEAYPHVFFDWNIAVAGKTWRSTDTALSYAGEAVEVKSLLSAAKLFYDVQSIDLTGSGCSVDTLLAIKDAFGAQVHSELELYGITFSTDTVELDFSNIPMEDTAAVEQILPLMPELEKVVMCDCGITSEEMDALWKRNPQVRFIWSVKIGRITLRTDCTNFTGPKHGYLANAKIADPYKDKYNRLFDEDCVEFKYCVDMVCLDLGHMGITDYSFLEYMPKLKYLILADTHGTDFTPLENLTELVFLELFLTDFSQTEVLLNMKKLEDLNIAFTDVSDTEDLKQMTWVKRIWMSHSKVPHKECVALQDVLPDTLVDYTAEHSTANNWRKNKNYYDMRDYLGMYYLD